MTQPDPTAFRDILAEALLDHLSRTADIRRDTDGELAFMPVVTDEERMRIATALAAVLPASVDRADDEAPLSPFYEHPDCGFRWHGRDGMDIPMRDGQPVCPRCELAAAETRNTTETQAPATVAELAHALDNSTPYPIELDRALCDFMAARLLEMLTIGKRPEHAVWQPEEAPEPGEQPQPEDPETLFPPAGGAPQPKEA